MKKIVLICGLIRKIDILYKSIDIYNKLREEKIIDEIVICTDSHIHDNQNGNIINDMLRSYCNKNNIKIIEHETLSIEMYVKLYIDKKISLDNCLGPLYGKWKMNNNNIIYHKTTYDYISLKNVLEKNNFKNIKLWEWKNTEHSNIDDYSQAYLPHMDKKNGTLMSLNIECIK